MLWSLIKIVLFVAIVAALTLGAGFLLESSGGVQVTVAGTEYTLGPLQSVLAALVIILLVWLFFKLFACWSPCCDSSTGTKLRCRRYFDRNRERKGYQALSEGLMALASGEGRLAMAKANKAEKYLHNARADRSRDRAGRRDDRRPQARPRKSTSALAARRHALCRRARLDEAEAGRRAIPTRR